LALVPTKNIVIPTGAKRAEWRDLLFPQPAALPASSRTLARIIHVSEDKRSLLCYKHAVETMFAVTKEASECLTIAQHSVCCSREFFANL
jgi:hypothetical protein